jgi:hydroxymethylpyrimidine pyrophosphatase-like HAD family hydrolase
VRKKFPDPPGNLNLSVLCIDLDGTLAVDTWPRPHIGDPIPEGVEALRYYATHGWACVVYTARPASHAQRVWDWLRLHNLHHWVYDVATDKYQAAGYLDDKAMPFPLKEGK